MARYLYGDEKWRAKLKVTNNDGNDLVVDEVGAQQGQVHQQVQGEQEQDEELEARRLNPPSIQAYLSEYDLPLDEDGLDALDWLKIYVLGNNEQAEGVEDAALAEEETVEERFQGKTASSKEDAKNLVNSLSAQLRKKIFSILYEQVHPEHRSSANYSKKDLILWLQKPNSVQNFLFYKVPGLKLLMDVRKINVVGRCNKEDRIAALAGTLPSNRLSGEGSEKKKKNNKKLNLPPKEMAIVKILEKSFLPHQKGDKREHCSLGHRLEKPILKKWVQYIQNDPGSPVPGLQVKSAYTAGLAAKRGARHAKDSIDFVVLVKEEPPSSSLDEILKLQDDNDEVELKAWGFEAKGRVTSRTALEEEEDFSSSLFYKHNRIKDFEVYDTVRLESERFQVLQHAYVYDFQTVVLAIGDAHSELIKSTIIDFSDNLKSSFGKVIDEMMSFSLDWYYSATSTNTRRAQIVTVPENILNLSNHVSNINGHEAMQGIVNLCTTLSNFPSPVPSFLRLIPAIYAFWNAVKGGSDTTTKLMDDCSLFVPHTNCETVASIRCIMLVFVLNHRLFQIFTANNNTDKYTSLFSYRKAASKRSTFHHTLLYCQRIFASEIDALQAAAKKENEGVSINNNLRGGDRQNQRRILPIRRRVDGVVPEAVTFGAVLPTNTPKKMTKAIHRGEAGKDVSSMISQCKGIPMKVYKTDYRGRCDTCQAKTNWYCVGCKRWFCMDRRNTNVNKKEINLYRHTVKYQSLNFQKQCYHAAHEEQWHAL